MIEKLFTSKNRIRILGYLFFNKSETYIREISRDLKIPVSAVKREIDNLSNLEIIEIKKKGIVLNEDCSFLIDLKNIFVKTDFIIYPIKDAFKKVKADFVFLFGSFARGNYREDSDVDLFVISDISLTNAIKIIRPIEDIIKRNVNPVVWTRENLKKEKESGFVKDIFRKGIIMIKGDENELRKIIE